MTFTYIPKLVEINFCCGVVTDQKWWEDAVSDYSWLLSDVPLPLHFKFSVLIEVELGLQKCPSGWTERQTSSISWSETGAQSAEQGAKRYGRIEP